MLTTLLGLVVAAFTTKHIIAIVGRLILSAMGRGVGNVAATGAAAGNALDSGIASRLSERITGKVGARGVFNKAKTSTAMEQFVVNTEDFGMVVFGSEEKYISALADKTIDAIAETFASPEGRKAAAKRLAQSSARKE